MKSLLVCIAWHNSLGRDLNLIRVLDELYKYPIPFEVIIDTNDRGCFGYDNVKIFEHKNLEHPFYLTWMHRQHIVDNIDKYDYFMYIEDDMVIPYENYLNYIENFKLVWPSGVPSFIRVEENEGKQFVVDVTKQQPLIVTKIGNKQFVSLENPYHAFWIMPQKELKETLLPNFVRVHQSREHAASYPMWELFKTPMVEIENKQVSKKCYSYHISNTYVKDPTSKHSKINPENIFI